MQDDEPNNSDRHVTKAYLDQALAATKGDFEQLFTTKKEMEQLLADQANVILEAVDEKLDKRFGDMMTGIDKVLKEVQAHREEDVAGAEQLRRHDDQLNNHERRINALELQPPAVA